MTRRSRNLVISFASLSACVSVGLLFGLSCDPGYNNHPLTGAGGSNGGQGGSGSGTGGQTGQGGSTTGTGGSSQTGTGGGSTTGTGGSQTGAGGGSATGTGGSQTGTGGGATGTGGDSGATNLISNGDFSNGETAWTFKQQTGTGATHAVTNGQYCVTIGSGQVIVGWPDVAGNTLHLTPSTAYVFTYTASSSSTAVVSNMDAKVGEFATPYIADFEQTMDGLHHHHGRRHRRGHRLLHQRHRKLDQHGLHRQRLADPRSLTPVLGRPDAPLP
jgi:hypothetical protein